MAVLTTKQRKGLSKGSFAIPGKAPGSGSYPIPDKSHAQNALARVSQYGSPSEKARVRAAVERKFPMMDERRKRKSDETASAMMKRKMK